MPTFLLALGISTQYLSAGSDEAPLPRYYLATNYYYLECVNLTGVVHDMYFERIYQPTSCDGHNTAHASKLKDGCLFFKYVSVGL